MILTVQRVSTSIAMALGLNKCAISSGSNTERAPQVWTVDGIPYLDRDMTYKYLGVKQHFGHGDTKATRDQIDGDLSQTVSKIVLSGLDSKTTVGILNSCVAGKARYYLATGLWTNNQAEIKLERRVRSKLSESGFHYRTRALERLYLPRRLGGRGLKSMSQTHDAVILALASYCQTATDPLPKRIWEAAWDLDQRHGIRRWYPAPGRL